MMHLSPEQLETATGGRLLSRPASGDVTFQVTTDSRTVSPGKAFFALNGPRFDGHDFIPAVLEQPGTAVVGRTGRVEALPGHLRAGHLVIGVADPLVALGDTARFVRQQIDVPVVGLTGSMGKTTVKELVRHILLQVGPGLATEGNYNNLIGLPLTLLQFDPAHRWVVLEMGMNAPGEIRRLQEIGQPAIRLVTNVAAAHTEGVGGIEGVAKAKGELFETAAPGDTVVVNLDDARVAALPVPAGVRRVTFGTVGEAGVRLVDSRLRDDGTSDVVIDAGGARLETHVPLVGVHQARNAVAAVAVAVALDIPLRAIDAGIRSCGSLPMRMELGLLPGGVTVINDAYNANPGSMRAALETLVAMGRERGRTAAVLGDMLELGDGERQAHEELGRDVATLGVERLFTIGGRAAGIARGAVTAGMEASRVIHANDPGELSARIEAWVRAGDVVLFKGSRGARIERVLEAWERRRIARDAPRRGLE